MEVYPSLVKPNAPSAKKRFGQHFLRDTGVIDRIARWIQPASGDIFLEIGAGDGAISRRLAPYVSRYLALEIDSDRIPQLEEALSSIPSVNLIHDDFLRLDLATFFSVHLTANQRIRIAGNLPYNIATVIIEKLLQNAQPILDMHLMVQLEVAQRITAGPSSKDFGYFSVYCQHHAVVQMGFRVSPACFVPRPKVNSAVIALLPKRNEWNQGFESAFDEVVKAAFSYRRKTLSNSLARHSVLSDIAQSLLNKAGIDGCARAEDISVSEYEHLAMTYHREFQNRK